MKRKQPWMRLGARVLAGGKPGKIVKMETNRINDVDYIYYMWVTLDDQKNSGPYHPADVEPTESEVPNA